MENSQKEGKHSQNGVEHQKDEQASPPRIEDATPPTIDGEQPPPMLGGDLGDEMVTDSTPIDTATPDPKQEVTPDDVPHTDEVTFMVIADGIAKMVSV